VSVMSTDEARSPQWGTGVLVFSEFRREGAVVVGVAGELDLATADALRDRLVGVVESDATTTIVLDLSNVSFIDACSIGVIVDAWSAARRHGRVLCVDGLHGTAGRVFELLGLEPILAPRRGQNESEGSAGGRQGEPGRAASCCGPGRTHAQG
jgi:anti-sigma B factor antagonist